LVHRDAEVVRTVRVAVNSATNWCLRSFNSAEEFLRRMAGALPDVLLIEWLPAEAADSAFVHQILQQWPRLPTLALLSQPEPFTVVTAIKAGVSGCVVKPIRVGRLLHSLGLAVQGRSVLCQQAQDSLLSHVRGRAGDAPLTNRQARIMELLKRGYSEKEIAFKLRGPAATIHSHIMRAYRVLGAHNRDQALKTYYHEYL
jgi:DNA-binding NarL/FixJ family response regulator